jgi:cytochrome c oxidase subunit 2
MKSRFLGIGRLAAGVSAAVTCLAIAGHGMAQTVGSAVDGGIGLQPGVTQIRRDQITFHDHILLPIIVGITLFVLALLIICVVRFNKRSNPIPAQWSHNTPVEVAWTVLPVLILMFVAIFSFKLLFEEHNMPRPYMTVKVSGRQWNWDYAYPDQKIDAITSTLMSEQDAKTKGLIYKLAADAPMVVPVNQVIRVDVTGEDVIHSFSVPAFGVKVDAIPGRLNETWFKAEKTGTFYGACSQLCGIDHAFMPIMVNVVSQADFDAWVASKAPKPAAPAASPVKVATAAPAAAAKAAPAAAQ